MDLLEMLRWLYANTSRAEAGELVGYALMAVGSTRLLVPGVIKRQRDRLRTWAEHNSMGDWLLALIPSGAILVYVL